MIPHDILTLYSAKMLEYGIAILFLVLFIPFWRYVQSSAVAPAPATAKVRVPAPATDWFALPMDRLFHRGHAWLKHETDGNCDGRSERFRRQAGRARSTASRCRPSAAAWARAKWPGAWWPMTGGSWTCCRRSTAPSSRSTAAVAANAAAAESDPYGHGWLLKVRPSRLRANQINLFAGQAARRWMDEVLSACAGSSPRASGSLAQDGGAPMHGMARAIDPEHWDELAGALLLTGKEERHA